MWTATGFKHLHLKLSIVSRGNGRGRDGSACSCLVVGKHTKAAQARSKRGLRLLARMLRNRSLYGNRRRDCPSGTALGGTAPTIADQELGWQSSASAFEWHRSGWEPPRLPTMSLGNLALVGSRRQARLSGTALAGSSHDCQPRASEIGLWLAVVGKFV